MPKNSRDVTTFAESCLPPLKSGDYELLVFQETEKGNSAVEAQAFSVQGPRFQLRPSDINSVYPPANMSGSFGTTIPHIVFERKTLPWERRIDTLKTDCVVSSSAPANEKPWLALILLNEDEIKTIDNNGGFHTDTVEQLLQREGNTYFPNLSVGPEEAKELCCYCDISVDVFCRIMPAADDISLLAHARQARQTAAKNANDTQDNYYSVVIGNRLPKASPHGTMNQALLVSLEGFSNPLQGKGLAKYQYVRLVILYSWRFYAIEQTYHLEQMFQALSVSTLNLEPVVHKTPNAEIDNEVLRLLRNGYVPLRHMLRSGDKTISFYRGPLAPVKVPETILERIHEAGSADKLYIYDPELGMFDVSYAVAWQLGRLLALSQKSVALKLMQNRNKGWLLLHRNMTDSVLMQCFDSDANAEQVYSAGSALLDYLSQKLGDSL